MEMKEIDVKQLKREIETGLSSHLIIDVRTPEERSAERIQGTINIPMSRINEQLELLRKYDAVYVHCGSGVRSKKVCESLQLLGLDNVVNVRGGMSSWDEHGFATVGAGSLSIVRQVHLVVGSMILLGILFAHYVNHYFIILPIFFAGGLTFSGLTGHCTMANILMKMPWNKGD